MTVPLGGYIATTDQDPVQEILQIKATHLRIGI